MRRAWVPLFMVAALSLTACGSGENVATPQPHESLARPTFRLALIADFGMKTEAEEEVSEAVESYALHHPIDALVTGGDNVYPYPNERFLRYAWGLYDWVDEQGIEVWATLGNHDVKTDNGDMVIEFFDMPGRYYSKIDGDAELFLLDGTMAGDPEQKAWLERELAESDSAWQIAVTHFPPFSCSRNGGSESALREFVSLWSSMGMDVVISGHEHNYQRFLVEGVTYIVAGGGGDGLYPVDNCPSGSPQLITSNFEDHHYLGIEGNAHSLVVTAFSVDGSVLDSVRLTSSDG